MHYVLGVDNNNVTLTGNLQTVKREVVTVGNVYIQAGASANTSKNLKSLCMGAVHALLRADYYFLRLKFSTYVSASIIKLTNCVS